MSDERDMRDGLGRGAPDDLVRLARRLERARPQPTPAFRGRLQRGLEADRTSRLRPARPHALIAASSSAGALLLLAAAVSVAGAGPLGT